MYQFRTKNRRTLVAFISARISGKCLYHNLLAFSGSNFDQTVLVRVANRSLFQRTVPYSELPSLSFTKVEKHAGLSFIFNIAFTSRV